MAAATSTSEAIASIPGPSALPGLIRSAVPGKRLDQEFLARVLETVASGSDKERLDVLAALREKGKAVLLEHRGNGVWYRGLLEFSNLCARDCSYCGIHAGNKAVERFTITPEEVVETALWCAQNGYGSITLQSGERQDQGFADLVEDLVRRIKAATATEKLPQGLGITLCVGEQSPEVLARFKAAGAHRYLLRVETTNPKLYGQLHPAKDGSLEDRVAVLRQLKATGWQVGSGVMIGLPGQTSADLARDLLFFVDEGIHMVGMGPYISHADTPLSRRNPEILPDKRRFELGLAMIALCRILLPKANIASTTALQALNPFGRELGLEYGGNILMPLVTPARVRSAYQLYDNKPCIDDGLDECRDCLAARVATTKRPVVYDAWGDSLLFDHAGAAEGSIP